LKFVVAERVRIHKNIFTEIKMSVAINQYYISKKPKGKGRDFSRSPMLPAPARPFIKRKEV